MASDGDESTFDQHDFNDQATDLLQEMIETLGALNERVTIIEEALARRDILQRFPQLDEDE